MTNQMNLPAPPESLHVMGAEWRIVEYRTEEGWPVVHLEPIADLPAVLVMAPGDYLGFFTGHLIARSNLRPITAESIARLAGALRVEATDAFAFRVMDVIVGYALLIVHGWHSPRFFRELAGALEANPEQTIAKYQNDPFVRLLIVRMMRDVDDILAVRPFADREPLFRGAARHLRDQMRKEIPRGRPNDKPVALFFESVVRLARRYGCDLRLPEHDESRGGPPVTPLSEFADQMKELLVEQLRAIGLPAADSRLRRVEQVTQLGLIFALERARAIVKAENH
jgi:hypothetical protein